MSDILWVSYEHACRLGVDSHRLTVIPWESIDCAGMTAILPIRTGAFRESIVQLFFLLPLLLVAKLCFGWLYLTPYTSQTVLLYLLDNRIWCLLRKIRRMFSYYFMVNLNSLVLSWIFSELFPVCQVQVVLVWGALPICFWLFIIYKAFQIIVWQIKFYNFLSRRNWSILFLFSQLSRRLALVRFHLI